jgi:hypothetical protein
MPYMEYPCGDDIACMKKGCAVIGACSHERPQTDKFNKKKGQECPVGMY